MDDDGITPKDKFSGTTTDITLKNHHIWGCRVCVLDTIFQGGISGLPKWEPCPIAGFYPVHSPFNSGSVDMVLNPTTGHVSPQFYVVFYDGFSTVPFMRECTILQNCTYLVQHSAQSSATENIDLKDTWFTPDIEEYPRETPSHDPSVDPENNDKMITSS